MYVYEHKFSMNAPSTPNNIFHKKIRPPKSYEKWILRILVTTGLLSSISFGVWFFDWDHVGHTFLFVILSISLSYKFLHFLYEWFYISSIQVDPVPEMKKNWSVDMLTTFVPGEPYDMIRQTLRGMVAVKYPHTTYLCDEGDDPFLKKMCEELGVIHLYRGKDKRGAKAGNINYALQHHARGDIAVILDPDHIPVPEFIDRVLPYFEDPKVGFVQSIQGYSNQQESWIAKGAAEQTYLYYGPLMMGMHKHGTVQAIGANCAFRRAALDSIDGHATGLCEDMHTSMQLHAKQWTSVYIPELLTRGRVPAALGTYYNQQLKWSRGCFELLFEVYPKLFSKFTFKQRVHYFLTPLYFFYGVIGLLDLSIPIYCLFTYRVPLLFDLGMFIWKILPVLISITLIRFYAQRFTLDKRESGFYFMGGILRLGSWWVYLIGFIYSILRKEVPYIPTLKEEAKKNDIKNSFPNILVILLSGIAIVYGIIQDSNPYSWLMAAFCFYNMVLLGVVVFLGQQKLLSKNYESLYTGRMSAFRLWWYRVRHSLVYPMLKSHLVAVNFSLFFLFTIFFLPFDKLFLNTDAIEEPLKRSGWFLMEDTTEGFEKIQQYADEMVMQNAVHPRRKQILPDRITTFDAAELKKCAYRLQLSVKDQFIPLFSINSGAITDSSFSADSSFWRDLAGMIKAHQQPVLLQVAPPQRFTTDSTLISRQKVIFRKIVTLFKEREAANALFAWNYDPQSLYPGRRYVDLVTITPQELSQIKKQELFHHDRPVLLSVSDDTELDKTLNSPVLTPDHYYQLLGWYSPQVSYSKTIPITPPPAKLTQNISEEVDRTAPNLREAKKKSPNILFDTARGQFTWNLNDSLHYIRGVVYNPENHWRDPSWPLTRRQLDHDFSLIKAMGANTISRTGASSYDQNIFKTARKHQISIIYNLEIDPRIDYFGETEKVIQLKERLLEEARTNKKQEAIIAWSVNSGMWMELANYFYQPYLTQIRRAYADFVTELLTEIRVIDPNRPILLSFDGNLELPGIFEDHLSSLGLVDLVGINTNDTSRIDQLKKLLKKYSLETPYLVNEFGLKASWDLNENLLTEEQRIIEPSSFEKARKYSKLWKYIEQDRANNVGGIAYCWKDRAEGTATLSGITDYKGRLKPTYFALKEQYTGQKQAFPLGDLKLTDEFTDLTPSVQFIAPAKGLLYYEWQVKKQEYLQTTFETSFPYQETTNTGFSLRKRFYEEFQYRFIPLNRGNSLRIKQNNQDNERVYLYIYDDQNHVVTASYPIDNAKR